MLPAFLEILGRASSAASGETDARGGWLRRGGAGGSRIRLETWIAVAAAAVPARRRQEQGPSRDCQPRHPVDLVWGLWRTEDTLRIPQKASKRFLDSPDRRM